MKVQKKILLILTITIFSFHNGYTQDKKLIDRSKLRIGVFFQYASSFKNVNISYPSLGYTGLLGGFTGKGGEIFGGYKLHKYLFFDLSAGFLLNSYSRSYNSGIFILGRFNKFYFHPNVKFSYPLIKGGFGTINPYIGGGIGITGSGRFYIQDEYYGYKDVTYAKYDPMIAPFIIFGTEIRFEDNSNLIIGMKYQNGTFNIKEFNDTYNSTTNIKNAPQEVQTLTAQGLALMLGLVHEF